MARVIEAVGPCRFKPRVEGTHFGSILRAIVYQQLSGKAAATILGRVHGLYGGREPEPHELIATEDTALRAAGLSRQKSSYLRDLAEKAQLVLDLDAHPDEEVIARLGRPDVLPAGDLGIQKAVKLAYRLRKHPAPARVLEIGKAWRPHATVASWYLWTSLET